jgi:predicted CxxxxCH...CXXCH cytochrome family protein
VLTDSKTKPAWSRRAGFVLFWGVCLAAIGGCEKAGAPHAAASAGGSAQAQTQDAGEYQFPCLAAETGDAGAPTFSAIYHELFCRSGCANIYCHGSRGANAGLSFETAALAYGGLVGVPASSDSLCADSGLLRVEADAPERSLLWLKLGGHPPCGSVMPPPPEGYAPASSEQLEQLRAWIANGAQQD